MYACSIVLSRGTLLFVDELPSYFQASVSIAMRFFLPLTLVPSKNSAEKKDKPPFFLVPLSRYYNIIYNYIGCTYISV